MDTASLQQLIESTGEDVRATGLLKTPTAAPRVQVPDTGLYAISGRRAHEAVFDSDNNEMVM